MMNAKFIFYFSLAILLFAYKKDNEILNTETHTPTMNRVNRLLFTSSRQLLGL